MSKRILQFFGIARLTSLHVATPRGMVSSRDMKPDDLLCYCFHVTKRKILNHLRLHKPRRASQLSECGGAGTGCGWCVPYLKKCFEQQANPSESTTPEITAQEYQAGRAAYIRAGKGTPRPGTFSPDLQTPGDQTEPE